MKALDHPLFRALTRQYRDEENTGKRDLLRLAVADWLEENGEPGYARYWRAEIDSEEERAAFSLWEEELKRRHEAEKVLMSSPGSNPP